MDDKSFFSKLQRAMPSMSEAKRSIAEYLMGNWQEVVFFSASKLARNVGVSESVVVRLAQDLGYTGFPDLQEELQKILRNRMTGLFDYHLDSNDTLMDSITDKHSSEMVQITHDLTSKNLQHTMLNNDFETFLKAVDLIVHAKKIVIVASRNASGPAMILSVHLNEIFTNTHFLAAGQDDMFDHLRNLTDEDLLITIALPGYSQSTVRAAKFAQTKDIKQLAITDSLTSPLAMPDVTVLLTSYKSYSFASSHVSTVFLIDVLLHLITIRDDGKVIRSLEELDLINRQYGLLVD